MVANAPVETMCVPGSYLRACSYNSAGDRLWYTVTGLSPESLVGA